MDQGNLRQLTTRFLHTLHGLPAFPPFCEAFTDLINVFVEDCPSHTVQRLFLRLLRIQIEKYKALSYAHASTSNGIQTKACDICEQFRHLSLNLAETASKTEEEAIALNLIAAACHEELGQSANVIHQLTEVERLAGAQFPLIEFALGYNLYTHALTHFTHYDSDADTYHVRDTKRFKTTCHKAINAFKRGMSNSIFDAQLHWWIGTVYESLQQTNAARVSYKRASALDSETFGADAAEKLASLPPIIPDATTTSEQERLASLPEISKEEIANTCDALEELEAFAQMEFGF